MIILHLNKQVELWKRYIDFEKSNPLRSEDTALVTRRVMFGTEQCLLVLTHHPAVWHQAAQYLDQSSKLLTEKGVRNYKTNRCLCFIINTPTMCHIIVLTTINQTVFIELVWLILFFLHNFQKK